MTSLIKLTLIDGRPMWINPDALDSVIEANWAGTKSRIKLRGDQKYMDVKEEPDEIMRKIIGSIVTDDMLDKHRLTPERLEKIAMEGSQNE